MNHRGRKSTAEVETLALEDRLLCVSHALARERLVSTLDKFIIMDDVTLEDLTDRFGTLALEGPATAAVVRELCGLDLNSLDELSHTETKVSEIPCRIVRRTHGGVPSAEFILARENLVALWNILLEAARQHGGGPVGYSMRLYRSNRWHGFRGARVGSEM